MAQNASGLSLVGNNNDSPVRMKTPLKILMEFDTKAILIAGGSCVCISLVFFPSAMMWLQKSYRSPWCAYLVHSL